MSTEEERATKQREAGEREQSRMWRIYRTAKEMVKDRGYEMSEVELKLTFEDFKRQFVLTDGGIEYVSYFLSVQSLEIPFVVESTREKACPLLFRRDDCHYSLNLQY